MKTLPPVTKKPATLADVAEIAGVSAKTVSRVVNKNASVSVETRESVEAAIRETGYRINQAARSLAASRSFLIGAFMPHVSSFYLAEIFRGAAKACRKYGYHLVLEEYELGTDNILARYEEGLRGAHCDALILTPPVCDHEELLDALDRDGLPYVRIAPGRQFERSMAVGADDREGVAQLAKHLWDSGRRRFAVIAGPVDHAAAANRVHTFVEVLTHLGQDPSQISVVRIDINESISEAGRAAALGLLDANAPRPDAIFTFNDEVAIGAMAALRDRGLSIPADVAVAGFDDSYIAKLAWPPLTTVHQPIADIAFQAVRIVAEETNLTPGRMVTMPTKLVTRGST